MVAPPLMSMDELPIDILSDILSRVSIESLLRYRCICKRWREVVDDFYFRNSVHRPEEPVLLYHGDKEEKIYILKEREEGLMKMIQIAKFPELKGYMLLGNCNGLLFFMHMFDVKNNPELLINPLTKEILRLPRALDLQPHTLVYGFGFDRATNTYKMVQINAIDFDEKTRTYTMGARVYDFEMRSWRTCKAPPSPNRAPRPNFVFASGALNWYLSSSRTLSFDLTSEEFSLIPNPDDFYGVSGPGSWRSCPSFWRWCPSFRCGDSQLQELGGSLSLLSYTNEMHLEVWTLKDSTSREWIRRHRIEMDGKYCSMLGQYKRDKLIFLHWRDRELYMYDVNKERSTRCMTEGFAFRLDGLFWGGTLSLVSLNPHGEETSARL